MCACRAVWVVDKLRNRRRRRRETILPRKPLRHCVTTVFARTRRIDCY